MHAAIAATEGPAAALRTEVEIFQLPQSLALKLIPRLLEPGTAAAAYAELESACDRRQAERTGTLLTRSVPGVPSVSRQVETVRYGMEYEMPDYRTEPEIEPGKPLAVANGAATYQERPVGSMLETQPAIDGTLQLSSDHSTLEGWDRIEASLRWDGHKYYVAQPVFRTRRIQSEIANTHGAPCVLGIFSMPERQGFWELHIATPSVRRRLAQPAKGKDTALSRQVRIELQRIRLAQDEALPLRARLLDPAQASAAHEALLRMVQEGSAELVEWSTLLTIEPQRAVSENVKEQRYATELEQPHPPQTLPPLTAEMESSLVYSELRDGGTPFNLPTTFDTRDTGETLGVEPSVSLDGNVIGMIINASNVRHQGFTRWGSGPDYEGNSTFVFQLDFKTLRTSTNLSLTNGHWMLLQFSRLQESKDQCDLTLLRTTTEHP